MVQDFCRSGQHEGIKAAVHGTAALISVVMATYNATAYLYRRDAHLRWNTIIYTLATCWEVKQTAHHLKRVTCSAARTSERPEAA
jgi:hypothetical protein